MLLDGKNQQKVHNQGNYQLYYDILKFQKITSQSLLFTFRKVFMGLTILNYFF